MTSYRPSLCAPIVIDSSNNYFHFHVYSSEVAEGTEQNISLTDGSYADIYALCTALTDNRLTFAVQSSGLIRVSRTDELLFPIVFHGTGTHPLSGPMFDLLGFDPRWRVSDLQGDTGVIYTTGFAPSMWVPERNPAMLSGWRKQNSGPKEITSIDGSKTWRASYGFLSRNDLSFSELPAWNVFSASATNDYWARDFEQVWLSGIAGDTLRFRPDYTSSSNAKDCQIIEPDSMDASKVKRKHFDLDTVDFELTLAELL